MALNIVLLIVGMALLVKGADWFVSGSSAIAKALKIPSLIIGLTLVSMGTSAPEASVSINSAVNGMNDMSIGNVVGSNIFNTLLILGVSSLIIPLSIGKDIKRYDIPIMVCLYGVMLLFAFVITPLKLDIFESVAMLVLFVAYTAFLIIRTKRANKKLAVTDVSTTEQTTEVKEEKKKPIWLSIILAIVGLAGIIFGGDLVVDNAAAIAKTAGMSETLVGLTIVAVGTSLPELVTSVVASIKKENDIAIGNVIGSNIFNIIFILGLSSTISNLTLNYENVETFRQREKQLNFLNKELARIIVKLLKEDLAEKDRIYLTCAIRTITDLERVGDYAENIVEYADKLKDANATFSETAIREINDLKELIGRLYAEVMTAYKGNDKEALKNAYVIEEEVDSVTEKMAQSHIERLSGGECTAEVGTQYLSLSANAERIADHYINVAKAIMAYD